MRFLKFGLRWITFELQDRSLRVTDAELIQYIGSVAFAQKFDRLNAEFEKKRGEDRR